MAVSSVVLGLFAALLSLLGFVGALVHERACLCLFGPIVLLLFLIAAGGLSVITNAQRVLDDWEGTAGGCMIPRPRACTRST